MDGVTPTSLRATAATAQTAFDAKSLYSTCVAATDVFGRSAYVVVDLRREYEIEVIQARRWRVPLANSSCLRSIAAPVRHVAHGSVGLTLLHSTEPAPTAALGRTL